MEKSKTRKRLWIAGAIGAVLFLLIGGWVILHRSWFSANHVAVTGAVHESTSQVIAAAGLASHPPLISINTGTAAAGVETLPWVKSATVSIKWPSSVGIVVVERTPVGMVAAGGKWLVVDATGRVLDVAATKPAGLLEVQVPQVRSMIPGHSIGPGSLPAATVAGSLPPAFRGKVALVTGHADGTVSLQLTAPVKVDLGQATDLTAKYQDIASVIAGATLHPGDILDVSVPQASTITGP